jgi:hypothetical protein
MTGATDFAGSTREHLAPPGSFLSTTPAVDPNRDRLRVINRVGAPWLLP